MDYSQSDEQELILAWAEDHRPGRWLDIGAADGTTASNTRALATRGWPGVAVEPAAIMFDRLTTLYRHRPDVACVQAVVTSSLHQPLVRFHYSHDLVSTTEDANANTWKEITEFTDCWVAAVTVQQLLACVPLPGPYDLVSIDTEGTSLELWDALRDAGAFASGALAVIEAENGEERFEIQQACLNGWARVGVTANNVLLTRLS